MTESVWDSAEEIRLKNHADVPICSPKSISDDRAEVTGNGVKGCGVTGNGKKGCGVTGNGTKDCTLPTATNGFSKYSGRNKERDATVRHSPSWLRSDFVEHRVPQLLAEDGILRKSHLSPPRQLSNSFVPFPCRLTQYDSPAGEMAGLPGVIKRQGKMAGLSGVIKRQGKMAGLSGVARQKE